MRKLFGIILAVLAVLLLVLGFGSDVLASTYDRYLKVDYVMDGDSIVAEGKGVRYLGIDAPEYGQKGFTAAKNIDEKLVKGKKIKFAVCREESKDKYGRILAFAYAGSVDVSAYMLKEGYAKLLAISPCVRGERYQELKKLEDLAKKAKKGIWK